MIEKGGEIHMSTVDKIGNKKGLKYIDCDVHPMVKSIEQLYPYISENWIKRFQFQKIDLGSLKLPSRYVHPLGGTGRPDAVPPSGGPSGSDPKFMIEQYLDVFLPQRIVLNPMQPASLVSWTDVETVTTLVSAFNDYYMNEWLSLDDRFTLAMVVAPHDPLKAAEEIRRIGDHKRISAVYLPLLNTLMGNSYYYPIYLAAIEKGLPIITHVSGQEGSFLGSPVLAGGIQNTYIDRYVNLIQVAQSNLSSLVFDGVFEKYPSLKVAFVEYGFSWVLSLMWRMDKTWTELRIGTPWVKKFPSEYIKEHVRFTSQPIDEPDKLSKLYNVIEMMDGEKFLMYSSDYPHWDNDMPTRVFTGLNKEVATKIFYENAKNFYRFS